MAGTARQALDPQVLGAGADGDAIVAGFDGGVEDGNVLRVLDVDSVGVGALSGGDHPHSSHLNVLAVVHGHVEHLAV